MERPERVPYEELDPCCQKELDDNKRYSDTTKVLRSKDRTYQRIDMKMSAMRNLRSGFQCECCKESRDYPILARLRAMETKRKEELEQQTSQPNEDEGEEDSDSDFDSDIDMDFITPAEQKRMDEVKRRAEMLEQAKAIGFTTHVEDSVEHLSKDIKSYCSIVLHLFSPDSDLCAQMDLILEGLALTYIGTKFRRIPYTQYLFEHPLLQDYSHVLNNIQLSANQHALLCIVNTKIIAYTYTFNEFCDHSEGTIIQTDLLKFLDHTRVLSTTMSYEDMKLYLKLTAEAGIDEDEEQQEEEENPYCDDPECTRRFPHEHIGRIAAANSSAMDGGDDGVDGSRYKMASFMKKNNVGEDALAGNVFLKV